MLRKKDYDQIFEVLNQWYPENRTDLHWITPFQLLIAVVMSAQTTDKQVNKATDTLFQTIKSPEDVIVMWLENYQYAIKSIGLYKTKAKNVFALSHMLVGKEIPDTMEELMKLPWVGEKTAKVVLHMLYGKELIAVDTHVHRVANRLGMVNTTQPLQTSKVLEKVIPSQYLKVAHHTLIFFGRYFCMARKPRCPECPFQKICLYYRKNKS